MFNLADLQRFNQRRTKPLPFVHWSLDFITSYKCQTRPNPLWLTYRIYQKLAGTFFYQKLAGTFLVLFFGGPVGAVEFAFDGALSFENQRYFEELGEPTRSYDNILHFSPELLLSGSNDRLVIKSHFRSNLSTDEEQEELFINLKEAYWEFKKYPFRMRLGQNTFSWGAMDVYSPVDVINSKAFFNPLSPEKLGTLSGEMQFEWENWRFQAVYIPQQRKSVLPSADSRWLPREVLVNTATDDSTILLPDEFNYSYPFDLEFDNALKDNFAVQLLGRLGDFDIGLMYFEGNSSVPHMRLEITATPITLDPPVLQATSDVGLIPVFFRQRVSGLSMTWAPSSILFRFEAAYTDVITKETDIPNWFYQTALGVEKPFSIFSKSLVFLVQGYYGENDDLSENLISSGNRIFDKAGLMGLRLSLDSQTAIQIGALHDFNSSSSFLSFKLTDRWWQTIDFILSGELVDGGDDSLLGSYRKNDRVLTQLGFSW